MTYDQWVQTYRPIRAADRQPSQTGDYHECELSPSAGYVVMRTLPHNVWTMVEGDDGESWYIVPGFHVVNRIGHVETVEAWTDEHAWALCIPYIEAADEPRYCDDCGDVLWQASQVHVVEELPVGILSANAGESATLCAGCHRRICETGGDGDA